MVWLDFVYNGFTIVCCNEIVVNNVPLYIYYSVNNTLVFVTAFAPYFPSS
jgi:hypothetical protein